MAVKYNRDRSREGSVRFENRYSRGVLGRPRNLRQRLFYIYFGVGIFLLLLTIYQVMQTYKGARWYPPEEGEARVVGKSVDQQNGRRAHAVDLAVTIPPSFIARSRELGAEVTREDTGRPFHLRQRVPVTSDSYDLVEEGTAVNVTYQVNFTLDKVMVREIRLQDAPTDATPPH